MSIPSIEFFALTLSLSAVFALLRSPAPRRAVVFVFSALFLYTHVADLATWGLLAAIVLSGYAAGWALMRRPSTLGLWLYLGALVTSFLLLKRYEYFHFLLPDRWFEHGFYLVGLSYILFRQIHFVVDMMEGQIRSPSLGTYLLYQLNAFTLLAGPIQRYGSFAEYWRRMKPVHRDVHALRVSFFRILCGVLAVLLIGDACLEQYRRALAHPEWSRVLRTAVVFYSYPAYVYFNFSGFCHIVIGTAALFGIVVPENFDQPYRARNMIDFWNRWHMTLSHWLRDYLFSPLYKALATGWPAWSGTWAVLCYFVVFVVAGAWHGSSLNFVVFGLLHGIGLSTTKAWESLLLRRVGRAGLRRYLGSRRIRVAAILVTFHFACATFLFFPPGLRNCLSVLNSLRTGAALP